MPLERGSVVDGPDPLGGSSVRPWVKLSDHGHPFDGEEGIFAALTRTERAIAVGVGPSDFVVGGLPGRGSYVSPWVLVTFKEGDMFRERGILTDELVDEVAEQAAWYLGVKK